MAIGFTKVDSGIPTDAELRGKRIFFALYDSGANTEAKVIVTEDLARQIDCRDALEALLASFRAAILDAAMRHGNPTAPRKQ
jgi:hypothetical protein